MHLPPLFFNSIDFIVSDPSNRLTVPRERSSSMRFVTFLSGLLACASLSQAAAVSRSDLPCSTNAECLRLGQRVLPPRKKWTSTRSGTTKAAKRATTSAGVLIYSIMGVTDTSGVFMGYVSKVNDLGYYGLVQTQSSALRVNRPDMTPSNSLIHPGDQVEAYPYLAARMCHCYRTFPDELMDWQNRA